MEEIKTEEEKRLKGRAEKFCEEYVIDYKAERAAVAAGYTPESGRNAAWRLLKKDCKGNIYIYTYIHIHIYMYLCNMCICTC